MKIHHVANMSRVESDIGDKVLNFFFFQIKFKTAKKISSKYSYKPPLFQ